GEIRRIHQVAPGALEAPSRVGQMELPGDVADQLAAMRVAGERSRIVRSCERANAQAVRRWSAGVGGRTADDRTLVVRELVQEEFAALVPELVLHASLDERGPIREFARGDGVAEDERRARDGACVRVHVAVEGGTKSFGAFVDVTRQTAVDVALHAVVQPVPAEHAM